MVRDIDKIIEVLRNAHQNLVIEQLRVTHPGVDDNGIWFFKNPATGIETQLESSTGNCPFLIESNRSSEREYANTIPQAISIDAGQLHAARTTSSTRMLVHD